MAVIKIVPMPGAVGDKGDEGAPGPQGPQGETGLQGPAGADAVWYYNGEYNPGASYVVGDVVTFEGQTWYRKNANGGNVGDTPSEGLFWDLIAAKGEQGLTGLEGEQGPQGEPGDTELSNMVRYSPTFSATGLAFTGADTTYPTYNSYYVKSGKMVSFVIEVDCSTVTNFGTGQYKLQLPFTPAVGFNHFSGWAQIDTAVNPDVTNGHVILNVDHAGVTDILDLHYLKQAGGAHTPIVEGLFLQGTPVTLTTSSKIYVNGTYISQ